eukprot:COSAG01_NODE_644_length_14557_cov_8.020057_13_plen_294_part_00
MGDMGHGKVLGPEELEALYAWVDAVPLSRPKSKSFARDFSDGVLVAEVAAHFAPKLVDMHNYIAANNAAQKRANWECLSAKVLRRLGVKLTKQQVEGLVSAQPMHAERMLKALRTKLQGRAANAGTGGLAKERPERRLAQPKRQVAAKPRDGRAKTPPGFGRGPRNFAPAAVQGPDPQQQLQQQPGRQPVRARRRQEAAQQRQNQPQDPRRVPGTRAGAGAGRGGGGGGGRAARDDYDTPHELLLEKDRVIAEVRRDFSECLSKIAAVELLVGLGPDYAVPPRRLSAPEQLYY